MESLKQAARILLARTDLLLGRHLGWKAIRGIGWANSTENAGRRRFLNAC